MTQMKSTPTVNLDLSESLYEVVDGEIVEKDMGAPEALLANRLVYGLGPFGLTKNLGWSVVEMLFLLDKQENLQRRPDVAFVSFQRWPRDKPCPRGAAWDVIPNLAVEIESPSNSGSELLKKVAEYFAAGVERVWVVYPTAKQVYVYRSPTDNDILTESDELDGEHIIPGFRFPLKDWF